MDYNSAKELLEGHAARIKNGHGVVAMLDPSSKRLANETRLTFKDSDSEGLNTSQEAYQVVYFKNPILHFYKDCFAISDHGWFAKTTHMRMNDYMPRGFSVYGYTPVNLLAKRRPLGFIKTPNGIYPYGMPAVFTYAGVPTIETAGGADHIIKMLPAYTGEYLTRLLAGTLPTDKIEELNTLSYWSSGLPSGSLSNRAAHAVLDNVFFASLATLAVEAFGTNLNYGGLSLNEIAAILAAEGGAAFKTPTTDTLTAERIERIIKHKMPMPKIPVNWLRSTLRPIINEFVVNALGFDTVEWNRRER